MYCRAQKDNMSTVRKMSMSVFKNDTSGIRCKCKPLCEHLKRYTVSEYFYHHGIPSQKPPLNIEQLYVILLLLNAKSAHKSSCYIIQSF